MKNATKRLAAMLAALMLLSACGRDGEQTPEDGGEETLTPVGQEIEERAAADDIFSVNYDPNKSLNPIKADSATNVQLWSLMYDSVFTVGSDYTVTSEIVTKYTTSDRIWWVFNVDTSIKFTDGTTLSAYDVAYSIRQAQLSSYYANKLSVIYGVSAMSTDTFAITTKYANGSLPALLYIPNIKAGSMSQTAPPGTGPYRLSEAGDCLELFADNRHAGEMPIDKIYLKSYMDTADRISAFEDSLIDIVTNDPTGVYNLGYGSSNETRYYGTTNMHFVGFNMQGMFFQSPKVRYAFAYILDRDGIVSGCLGGNAEASALPVPSSCGLYDADYDAKLRYDPEKFLRLLEAADVRDYDDDGLPEFRVTGIIVKTDIKFIVNNNSTAKVLAARRITENLNAAGIKTTLYELAWDDYVKALEDGDYDMYYGEIRLSADWNLAYMFEKDSSMNYANCTDASFAELYYAYLAADETERVAAFNEAEHDLIENGGLLPVCFERMQVLTHRGVVSGLRPTEYDLFYNFAEWTISMK